MKRSMETAPVSPTAEGSFGKTPFPHLLVYALERRLSGSFVFEVEDRETATMLLAQGFPAKIRTADRVHTLGEVMAELGMISAEQLAAARARKEAEGGLQGRILRELGAVDDERVEAALRVQIARKVEHLFRLPAETIYAYFDAIDLLSSWGETPTPSDPIPALWRGIKSCPPWEHIDGTLRRVGAMGLRLNPAAQSERFALTEAEASALAMLREGPVRLNDLAGAKLVAPAVAQQLVYFLVITKQVELVEVGAAKEPKSQAFARVQLQPRPVTRPAAVVEEMAASAENDDRASIPGAPSPSQPDAHAEMQEPIANSIDSSPPPALSPDEEAIKTKILERAEQITSQTYFEMLGVGQEATTDAIQQAFFGLAKVWHPDRLPPALRSVKDACSKVFSHLTEAHATLTDAKKRQEYMMLLKEGGATPDDQAKIQTILEAATEFQKAEILMKRNLTDPKVLEHVKRAIALDPEQSDYMALHAWVEAQSPEWQPKGKTLEKIAVLDKCIEKNPRSERAYFYRAMLHKRVDDPARAIRDFKRVAELNPKNLDAAREVRLHNMRGGSNKQPPADKRGGLFGKLFKK